MTIPAIKQPPLETTVPRLIAFYLTQFHPTPENDQWWGKGFTEWTNVTKAMPLFDGHYQPHLPSDFGFYDLRVRETRRDQINMAKRYGIDGFCYHYYWFSGKRILNLPLDDMLADDESDMPFCLCWANENWTRRWDAADHEVLIAQKYQPEDDVNFIKSLVPFFQDRRYIKLEGKPFLIVYRPQQIPNAVRTVEVWRNYCRSAGIGEIHLCAALTHGNEDYTQFGFDSGVEFPPHNVKSAIINDQVYFHESFHGLVLQYETIAKSYLARTYGSGSRVFKTVFPSWDNTARTKNRALIVLNGTPDNFEHWLACTLDLARPTTGRDQLVFINAWNEWAEGCHLEPDREFGHGFLQATLHAKNGLRRFNEYQNTGLPDTGHISHRTFRRDMGNVVRYHAGLSFSSMKAAIKRRPWLYGLVVPLSRVLRAWRAKVM
jgi:lipopolysaccharide biosynthesis protein